VWFSDIELAVMKSGPGVALFDGVPLRVVLPCRHLKRQPFTGLKMALR
jgi:hypothetical protein